MDEYTTERGAKPLTRSEIYRGLFLFIGMPAAQGSFMLFMVWVSWTALCNVAVCRLNPPASFWVWIGGMFS